MLDASPDAYPVSIVEPGDSEPYCGGGGGVLRSFAVVAVNDEPKLEELLKLKFGFEVGAVVEEATDDAETVCLSNEKLTGGVVDCPLTLNLKDEPDPDDPPEEPNTPVTGLDGAADAVFPKGPVMPVEVDAELELPNVGLIEELSLAKANSLDLGFSVFAGSVAAFDVLAPNTNDGLVAAADEVDAGVTLVPPTPNEGVELLPIVTPD
mmetsp:Transcript_9082/g.13661  ORF Transcript_9082/g.13661 Transcript_9082/m.13661 type:complete len:208 (+) Transcript_9082:664-1287(+)